MKRLNIILLLICNTILNAQSLKIICEKNPAIIGERVLIQYSINAKGNDFKPPKFNGLRKLSGPNRSSSSNMSFINGKLKTNHITTYSFYLKASKAGIYNITPAKVTINGEEIQSKAYQLKVVKGSQKQEKEQQKLEKNLFIKVTVDKKNIFVGEQILVTYKLFTRYQLQNPELSSLPDLNGFWTKDLATSSEFKREVINGIPYNVATIKKSVLTAQKSGKLKIDPIEIRCGIVVEDRSNNQDPFANFFNRGYTVQEELVTSKPITITVNNLPNTNTDFKGAVGNLDIDSEVDNIMVNANDAITYKLKVIGTGNIELIKPLFIDFPEDFEVYDPKISDQIYEGGRKRSIRTFEYLIIPRYKGEYKIPSVELVFYNSNSKKYEIKKSPEHLLTIKESLNTEEKNSNVQQKVKTQQKDINYIEQETKLKLINKNIIPKSIFYLLILVPIILLIFLNFYNKIIGKKAKNSLEWKNRKANKIAQKRLKSAQKCINNADFDGFFEEIEKSLWGYFADKFQVNAANLSKETISEYFFTHNINDNIKEKFINLLNECELARYAPTKKTNTQIDTLIKKAKTLIIKVETALK